MRSFSERYGIHEGRSLPEGGVRGIAMPFNESDQRPGIAFSDEDDLIIFEYKLYDATAFDLQLDEDSPSKAGVQFQFQHGGRQHDGSNSNPLAAIPSGRVEKLEVTPAALLFTASFNVTSLSKEVQISVARHELSDISVGSMIEDFVLENDADGQPFVRIIQARLLDVSIVDHGQYPQARILEHLALAAPRTFIDAVPKGQTLVGAIERYTAAPTDVGTPIVPRTTPVATSTKNGPGDNEMVVSKEAWGNLWGALNDLRTENATLRLSAKT